MDTTIAIIAGMIPAAAVLHAVVHPIVAQWMTNRATNKRADTLIGLGLHTPALSAEPTQSGQQSVGHTSGFLHAPHWPLHGPREQPALKSSDKPMYGIYRDGKLILGPESKADMLDALERVPTLGFMEPFHPPAPDLIHEEPIAPSAM